MRKIISAVLVAVMLLSLAACSSTGSSVSAIKQRKELVMLTNAAFPPFEYVDGTEVVGVDVDIANEIAKELGVSLVIKNMDFDLIVDYIKAGKGDVGIAGMTVNEERLKNIDFSIEYVTSVQYIIVPAGTDVTTFDPNDKIIGVQQGTTGDIYYASDETVIKAKDVKRYKNAIDAAEELKLGRLDCVIIDEMPALKIVEASEGKLECFDPGYGEEKFAIAVQKDNKTLLEAVNKVLERLIAEGKVDEFVIKHSS